MGAPSSVWVLALEFTCMLVTFSTAFGASSECPAFSGCSCDTVFNDRGIELGTSVDCSSRGLTTVPIYNTSDNKPIYELKLNNNSIVSLGENILSNVNIIKLDLSNNPISSVHVNTFGTLRNYLKILILSGNSTSEPPKDAFTYLQQLEELTLKNYNVPHLDSTHNYFISLVSLRYLTLDNWRLESVDPGSFQQSQGSLFNLTLLNQPMHNLPVGELQSPYFRSLKRLQISGTNINNVTPHAFEKLDTIQELDLSNNQIQTLDENCFNNIEDTLVKLSLSNNFLTPSKLSGLKNLAILEELHLSSNTITSVPNLSQLQTTQPLKLYLNSNSITTLAANEFTNFADKLHTLDLSQNQIVDIQANSFINVTRLEVLDVSYQTGVSRKPLVLPQSLTKAARTLKQLYVGGQEISPQDLWLIIGQFSVLEILNLASTQLVSIPDFALENLINLKRLDLSNNRLNAITPAALVGPRQLNYLSLTGNPIFTLSSCMFNQYTSNPITMTLGSTSRLTCDCTVRWLWNRINNKSIIFPTGQEAYCSDNQLLVSKKIDDFCKSPNTEPPCKDYYTASKLTISLGQIDATTFTVSWQLSDSRDLRNVTVTVTNSHSHQSVFEKTVPAAITSVTVTNLMNNTQHMVCVVAFFNTLRSISNCTLLSTIPNTTDKTNQQTDPGQEEIGIIIGAVIGAVVLLAILGAIAYLLIVRRKTEKKEVPNNVPVQPRNFSKSELPAMNEDTRTFSKPKKPRRTSEQEHREGMQVVAISDGQTGQGRVGRAQLLHSNGSIKTSVSSKPSSVSDQSSHEAYENDHRPLPPTPSKHPSTQLPSGYYNQGYKDDTYDEIVHGKESIL